MQAERAAIYARLSRNRNGESDNCEIQTLESEEYAAERGYRVTLRFDDDDISASKFSKKPRPDFDRLIEAVKANQVDVLLATEMSRLYRQIEELLIIIKLAETTKLRRIETTDGQVFMLHTPEGIHAAIQYVNNAMLESAKISVRVKRKKRAQAIKGVAAGGPRPFGYKLGGVEVDEDEAKIVRQIVRDLLASRGIGEIIRDLNARGVKTAKGGTWSRKIIRDLVTRARYYAYEPGCPFGIRVHYDEEYKGTWPALLPFELREQVKVEIRIRATEVDHIGAARSHLLTGLAICGKCGSKMVCTNRGRRGEGKRPAYYCRKEDGNYQEVGCNGVSRNGEALEDFVVEAVLYRLDHDGLAKALMHVQEDKALITELMVEVDQRKQRVKDIDNDYSEGRMDRSRWLGMSGKAQDALLVAQERLQKELQSRTVLQLPTSQNMRGAWDKADFEWQRKLLSLMIREVVVHSQTRRPVYKDLGRFDPTCIEIRWKV